MAEVRKHYGVQILFTVSALCICSVAAQDAGSGSSGSTSAPAIGGRWAGGCLTPDEQTGTCIAVTQCPPLIAKLRQRPVPYEDVQFLRHSQCGFNGNMPLVCCRSSPVSVPRQPQPLNNNWSHQHGDNANIKESNEPKPTRQPSRHNSHNIYGVSHPNARLLPTETCGNDLAQRIFGGEEADLGEFPWMALLQYRDPRGNLGFYCGGVLISDRYVLTAAHCIAEDSVKLVSVRLGEHNTKTTPDCKLDIATNETICAPPAVDIPVEGEIPYPEYSKRDSNHYNDIALLRLRHSVTFSDYVIPICLPLGDVGTKSYVGKKLWVAGWGKTETRSESDIKLKLPVPVVSNTNCDSTYQQARVRISDSSQLCAGGQSGKDSCNGDSGGPLMSADQVADQVRWHATGVVAFGPVKCGMKDWPGVYTRVSHYVDWILDTIRP